MAEQPSLLRQREDEFDSGKGDDLLQNYQLRTDITVVLFNLRLPLHRLSMYIGNLLKLGSQAKCEHSSFRLSRAQW